MLNYFLRTMPVEATAAAAARHDELIAEALHAVAASTGATAAERRRAEAQARLPVKMGGLGLTSQVAIAQAARVGSWALCWRPLQQLCARVFGDVDLTTAKVASFDELRSAHRQLLGALSKVRQRYADYGAKYFDYDKEGEGHEHAHPAHLPPPDKFLPLSLFGSASGNLQNAQRTWSQIVHHGAWYKLWSELAAVSTREALRLVAVMQPYAGAWLNAVPKSRPFQIHTWAMRLLVQRRLGLPLTAVAAEGATSKHGKAFDVMGDLAANDGKAGHQSRHHAVLVELVTRLRTVWGSAVEYEAPGYTDYSDTRPDLAVHRREGLLLGDVKVKDPVGSDPGAAGQRGAHVDMGNTLPGAREEVVGRKQRGQSVEVDGRFRPPTGAGFVSKIDGDYKRALESGCEVLTLLFETFGGFGPGVVELVRRAAVDRGNKLRGSEYDATTWSARTWTSFTMQRMSCALMVAVAWETASAMELTRVRDARDDV